MKVATSPTSKVSSDNPTIWCGTKHQPSARGNTQCVIVIIHFVSPLCSMFCGVELGGGGISKIIYKISWKKNLVLEKIVLAPSNHFGHPKIFFKGFSALKNTFSYLKSFWPQKRFSFKTFENIFSNIASNK